MPESRECLRLDSRWPAIFPSAICLAVTGDDRRNALEKIVGPCIVNRFPLVMSLSICREHLSERHHSRQKFIEQIEANRIVAVQFMAPGDALAKTLSCIASIPEVRTHQRMAATGLGAHPALSNAAPVFEDAYLVYEGRLVDPGKDFRDRPIFEKPYSDLGSHRVYFFEVEVIQLREDLASRSAQIRWQSLPDWRPPNGSGEIGKVDWSTRPAQKYLKSFSPYYAFPSSDTIAFKTDGVVNGMAFQRLLPLPDHRLISNDDSRWPCFFPASLGLITTWCADGSPNVMPCGSTVVVSRDPFTIGIAVAYAQLNERYAPRASLDNLRRTGRFGCAVPYASMNLAEAIQYMGTTSIADDPAKVCNSGLRILTQFDQPILPALPLHFDCRIIHEQQLGTHVWFVGSVERILCRNEVNSENSLLWTPFAIVPDRNR